MKFYARKRRMPAVIIVSLIDILAILLIFVIVTTTFKQSQPEVVIKLPDSATAVAAPNPSEPSVLSIAADGRLFLDDQAVVIENLKTALVNLLTAKPDRAVALKADTNAPFGIIIKVLDALKQAHVKNVPALTETKAP